jgi:hypothetical protein
MRERARFAARTVAEAPAAMPNVNPVRLDNDAAVVVR